MRAVIARQVPTEKDQLRARHITSSQIVALEELWKTDSRATLADLDKPGMHVRHDVAVRAVLSRLHLMW